MAALLTPVAIAGVEIGLLDAVNVLSFVVPMLMTPGVVSKFEEKAKLVMKFGSNKEKRAVARVRKFYKTGK